jgi:hypothetical protein
MSSVEGPYVEFALSLARISAKVANYCDHVEHNELAERAWVLESGEQLRLLAYTICATADLNLQDLYVQRLQSIERRNVHWSERAVDGAQLAADARSWRDLQHAQIQHDLHYHPDVAGLTKYEQLRHYAFHVAKLAGAAADVAGGELTATEFCEKRLPDILLFGIKLSTVCNEKLSDTADLTSPV